MKFEKNWAGALHNKKTFSFKCVDFRQLQRLRIRDKVLQGRPHNFTLFSTVYHPITY
jgi:hypothetical protein